METVVIRSKSVSVAALALLSGLDWFVLDPHERFWLRTRDTCYCSVCGHSCFSCDCASIAELARYIAPLTEVHFIGRLTFARRMWNDLVVLVDVEFRLLTYVIDCRN